MRHLNGSFEGLDLDDEVQEEVSDIRWGRGGAKRTLTLADSYNLYVFMSTMSPVSPSIPHECSPFACFAY